MQQQNKFDFSDIPIVDTHAHAPLLGRNTSNYLRSPDFWYDYFLQELIPSGSTDDKLKSKIKSELIRQSESRPNWTNIRHFIAKSYGLKSDDMATVEAYLRESITQNGVKTHSDKIFQKENISWLLVDHSMASSEPVPNMDEFPDGKKKWTHPITHMLAPQWARNKGLETAGEISAAVVAELNECKKNGCSGFKSHQAYFRDLSLHDVTEDEATAAYRQLEKSKPGSSYTFPVEIPKFETGSREAQSLLNYQDFVLKTIFCETGRIGLTMLFHVAAALTPSLKPWNNDPEKLYSVLDNDSVRAANTQFMLLHTGYPEQHKITTLISQYPNLYVDLSWISVNTFYLDQILAEFLSIASSTKITHGSDSANPDVIAFGAHNTRMALSKIANRLHEDYAWSEDEIFRLAENVLHANADRIFGTV